MSDFDTRSRLTAELHDRSQGIGGHPVGLEDVKLSARRIQRRRRIASGAVAAAVVVVAVPAALAVTNAFPNGQQQPSPAGPTPTAIGPSEPSPTSASKPVELSLDIDGITRSGAPLITYVSGNQIIRPDGKMTEVDRQYVDVTPYYGGWVGLAHEDVEWKTVMLNGVGDVLSTSPGGSAIAVTSDDRHLAWFSPGADGGTLHAEATTGEASTTWQIPSGVQVTPVGMLASSIVVYQTEGADPRVTIATDDGQTRTISGMTRAGGVSDQASLVSGQVRTVDDSDSCGTVFDVEMTKFLWQDCSYQLGQFSPNGRYVLASSPYDGQGATDVALLNAETGEAVRRFESQEGQGLFVHEAVWEDPKHVLATVFEDGEWTMVRMSLDGYVTAASPAIPGDETSSPFEFAARP